MIKVNITAMEEQVSGEETGWVVILGISDESNERDLLKMINRRKKGW